MQPISFKKLTFILEQTPLNQFLEFLQPDSGFTETINRATISNKVVALTLKAIATIVALPMHEHNKCFLKSIFDSKNYWKQIDNYVKEITTSIKSTKDKRKIIEPIFEIDFWENLICFCQHMIKYYKIDNAFFEKTIKYIENSKFEAKLTKYKDQLERIQKLVMATEVHRDIHPTLEELLADDALVPIKPNIVQGRYPSISHYLDVHLSLLREDFISPLRDGIRQFRKDSANGILKSNADIRLYAKVRILTKQKLTTRNHKGEYLMVDLDPDSRDDQVHQSPKKSNEQNFSKKLMYGSLLVLTTSDKFEDLILAVVSNRDTDLLNQGYVSSPIIKQSFFVYCFNLACFSYFRFKLKSFKPAIFH